MDIAFYIGYNLLMEKEAYTKKLHSTKSSREEELCAGTYTSVDAHLSRFGIIANHFRDSEIITE